MCEPVPGNKTIVTFFAPIVGQRVIDSVIATAAAQAFVLIRISNFFELTIKIRIHALLKVGRYVHPRVFCSFSCCKGFAPVFRDMLY